jgi:ketosteroid isomerase-like protein
MSDTRRGLTAATGADLTTSASATAEHDAVHAMARSSRNRTVENLIERSFASNTALMRGDVAGYRALVSYTEDFTLMSPFGGEPTHGRDLTPARWEAMGRFFRNGKFSQDVVQFYHTNDMVVLAVIEHCSAEVGGLPYQEWPLRVTLVYRHDGSEWRLAHRHADPLVAGVSHATAAALARGEIK